MKPIIQKLWTVMAMLCLSISASAYDFEVDGIAYTITSFSDLTCSVAASDATYEGEITVPSEVTFNGKTLTVTSISDSAFKNSLVTSVQIPMTIIEIEANAFANCENLCYIVLMDGLQSIGDDAFNGCESLSSILIPETVESIGVSCFGKCKSLKSVVLPKSLKTLGSKAFIDCLALEFIDISNLTIIEDYTFFRCENLKEVAWGTNINILKDFVFANCGFENFVIPNTITHIGQGILSSCLSLKSLTIGNGITTLSSDPIPNSPVENLIITDGDHPLEFNFGNGTFQQLWSDSSNTYYIRDGAYCNKKFEYIYIGRSIITSITRESYSNFHPIYYTAPPFYSNKSIKKVNVSPSVASLNGVVIDTKYSAGVPKQHYAYGFFENCSSLENLSLLGLNSIGENFANGCISLEEIEIPNNVATIGPSAFQFCTKLKTIIFGSKLQKMEANAFDNCNALTSIYCKSKIPPTYSTGFNKDIYLNCHLNIPFETEQSYKSASPWNNFWNISESQKCVSEFVIDDLIYTVTAGNNVIVSGNIVADEHDIVIPSYVEYYSSVYNVVGIGTNAFKEAPINSILIPGCISNIGNDAFSGCRKLKRITMEYNDNAIIIGHKSALQLSNSITPYPNATTVDEKRTGFRNGYYDGLFYGLPIEHLIINRDIELPKYYERTMGSSTSSYSTVYNDIIYYPPFYGLTNLRSVEIGENVSSICKNQIEAVVNAVPTTMEYTNFGKCDNIEVVVSNNPTAPIGGGVHADCL